jgi:FKBP-type peptidyl-prolyl cis-trans isomerase 2
MSEHEDAGKHHKSEGHEEAHDKTIKAGDVVLVEFDAWVQDSNDLFDTTSESVAKENNIHDEKATYGPQPLIVGKGRLFEGLDESMLKAEVGKEHEVEIPPEKAAGPRDPKLVELHPVREFLKQEVEPRVGLEVMVKNRPGIVTAVTAGRVRVDFNNKLAGRTLRYKYKITEKITKPNEIVKAVLRMAYGTPDGFEVEHHGQDFTIKLAESCKYDQRWILAKYRVVSTLREVLEPEKISLVEEYLKPEKKEPEEEKAKEEAPEKPGEESKEKAPEPAEERAPEELTEEDRKGPE